MSTLKRRYRVKVVPLMAVFSVMMFTTLMQGKMHYWEAYQSSYFKNTWETMNEALDKLPKDASVAATTDYDINQYLKSDEYETVAYTPCVIGVFKRVNSGN